MTKDQEKEVTVTKEETAKDEPGPRERILQAALDLFVEQGYFNTNVPDISRRSRCSVGSIYHHFLNKEEIAGNLYDLGIKRFREALANAIDSNAALEPNIRGIVVTFLTFAEDSHVLSRYLWLARHSEYLSAEVRHPTVVGYDELGRRLTKAVKNGIRKGEIGNIKAEILWSIVFGMPLSFVRDWLDGYTKTTPREVAPVMADACWAALQGLR
jgi:AcrR family transcriptional regulator